MRKFVLLFGFACFVFVVNAQKHNIVNSSIALKNANKTDGEEMVSNLIDAKNYIDEAFLNTSTSDEPKMWNYRAKVYLKIALKLVRSRPQQDHRTQECWDCVRRLGENP